MDGIVVLLAVLAGGAVLAGILAFVVLSAIAALVEILPPGAPGGGDGEDREGRAAGAYPGPRRSGPAPGSP